VLAFIDVAILEVRVPFAAGAAQRTMSVAQMLAGVLCRADLEALMTRP
jgi:hypothetical protein